MVNFKDIENLELNISEIFFSIQGEGSKSGLPCIFVRLQGCRLRCSWCDTPYALELKQIENLMKIRDVLEKIKSHDCKFVEFTGGEPLEHEEIIPFMEYLCDNGFTVAIETAGYLSVEKLDKRIIKIMDFKCPSSKMSSKNNYENVQYLTQNDEIKFVIQNREDYEFTKGLISKYNLENLVGNIILSPVFGKMKYIDLANWILEDSLNVRFQLQVHKYIWHPDTRGV